MNDGLARGAYELNDDVVAYPERSGAPDKLAYGNVPVKLKLPCIDTLAPNEIRLSEKYDDLAGVFGII